MIYYLALSLLTHRRRFNFSPRLQTIPFATPRKWRATKSLYHEHDDHTRSATRRRELSREAARRAHRKHLHQVC